MASVFDVYFVWIQDWVLVMSGISEGRKPGGRKLVHNCNTLEGNYQSFPATALVGSTPLLVTVK